MTPAGETALTRQEARYAAEDAVRAMTVGSYALARQSLRDALNLLEAAGLDEGAK